VVPLCPESIAELACAHENAAGFEAAVLEVLERHIGCDVAFFCGPSEISDAARGLDPSVRPRARERWGEMSAECLELLPAARRGGGVVIDSEWFGARLERLVYYDTIMRPHHGRTTLMAFLECQGRLSGELVIGRCRGSSTFSDRDVQALRRLVPVLSLSRHAYLGGSSVQAACAEPAAQRQMGSAAGLAVLTPREREVLGYLHLGYTNQQIGLALGSAQRTVRNQLSRVYGKLGISTRAEAVAWGLGHSPVDEGRSRFKS
jgi:DNA-binding CsgD family transcriptional regulator